MHKLPDRRTNCPIYRVSQRVWVCRLSFDSSFGAGVAGDWVGCVSWPNAIELPGASPAALGPKCSVDQHEEVDVGNREILWRRWNPLNRTGGTSGGLGLSLRALERETEKCEMGEILNLIYHGIRPAYLDWTRRDLTRYRVDEVVPTQWLLWSSYQNALIGARIGSR